MVPFRSPKSVGTFLDAGARRARMKRAMDLAQVALARDACRFAWSRYRCGRASPAPRADRRRLRADGWRNNGASVCGLIHASRGSVEAHPLSALKNPWRVIARPSRVMNTAETRRGEFSCGDACRRRRRIENLVATIQVEPSARESRRRPSAPSAPCCPCQLRPRTPPRDSPDAVAVRPAPKRAARSRRPSRASRDRASPRASLRVDRVDKIFDVARRQGARQFARMRPQLDRRRRIALDDLFVDQLARQDRAGSRDGGAAS